MTTNPDIAKLVDTFENGEGDDQYNAAFALAGIAADRHHQQNKLRDNTMQFRFKVCGIACLGHEVENSAANQFALADALNDLENSLINVAGGFSVYDGHGAWHDGTGGIVLEPHKRF